MRSKKIDIKICRITDIHTARYLARLGVEFLGLHAIFELPEEDLLVRLQKVIYEISNYYPGTKTVLVTRIDSPKKLLSVYKKLPTDFVQISSDFSAENKKIFLERARKYNKNIQIFNVLSSIESSNFNIENDVVGDHVIIDKEFAGGTGEQIPKEVAKSIVDKLVNKYILMAGGMGRVDPSSWLKGIRVAGVDIMSSMEFGGGDKRKDINKITAYFSTINNTKNINLSEFPANKELSYLYITTIRQSKIVNLSEDYDLILVKYNPKTLPAIIENIHRVNQFIPIALLTGCAEVSNLLEWLRTSDLHTQNIDSVVLYNSEILDRNILYKLSRQNKKIFRLGLFADGLISNAFGLKLYTRFLIPAISKTKQNEGLLPKWIPILKESTK